MRETSSILSVTILRKERSSGMTSPSMKAPKRACILSSSVMYDESRRRMKIVPTIPWLMTSVLLYTLPAARKSGRMTPKITSR